MGVGLGEPAWLHSAVLLGFTVLFLGVALWAYRRDEGKTYG
jgi:ABC-2 type transport system permease protein